MRGWQPESGPMTTPTERAPYCGMQCAAVSTSVGVMSVPPHRFDCTKPAIVVTVASGKYGVNRSLSTENHACWTYLGVERAVKVHANLSKELVSQTRVHVVVDAVVYPASARVCLLDKAEDGSASGGPSEEHSYDKKTNTHHTSRRMRCYIPNTHATACGPGRRRPRSGSQGLFLWFRSEPHYGSSYS